jgi:hypothetical protein
MSSTQTDSGNADTKTEKPGFFEKLFGTDKDKERDKQEKEMEKAKKRNDANPPAQEPLPLDQQHGCMFPAEHPVSHPSHPHYEPQPSFVSSQVIEMGAAPTFHGLHREKEIRQGHHNEHPGTHNLGGSSHVGALGTRSADQGLPYEQMQEGHEQAQAVAVPITRHDANHGEDLPRNTEAQATAVPITEAAAVLPTQTRPGGAELEGFRSAGLGLDTTKDKNKDDLFGSDIAKNKDDPFASGITRDTSRDEFRSSEFRASDITKDKNRDEFRSFDDKKEADHTLPHV